MRTRERFGDFLLLKKLSEDPLGEVFRAGRLAGDGVDQVLLLRVFNGSAVQGVALQAALQRRKPLQQLLRSPNLAQGVDAGEYQGVPYVAYDYVSGKDLATLMEQAVRRSSPVPSEHALLIVDRLALGLTVAYGARLESQRVSHGFLVPQLVMLSNEGENRLLGFEVSEGLRASAKSQTPLGERYGRYLSPEALQGRPLTSTDDVYSLGVILLELLVSRPLPHPSAGGHSAEIERVASLGFPKIASLIERSLLPAPDRIGDVVTWHKTLDQLVRESNSSSTPFHLAFYMHNLFREDIERETVEIQTEKTLDFSKEDLRKLLHPEQQAAPSVAVSPPSPPAAQHAPGPIHVASTPAPVAAAAAKAPPVFTTPVAAPKPAAPAEARKPAAPPPVTAPTPSPPASPLPAAATAPAAPGRQGRASTRGAVPAAALPDRRAGPAPRRGRRFLCLVGASRAGRRNRHPGGRRAGSGRRRASARCSASSRVGNGSRCAARDRHDDRCRSGSHAGGAAGADRQRGHLPHPGRRSLVARPVRQGAESTEGPTGGGRAAARGARGRASRGAA